LRSTGYMQTVLPVTCLVPSEKRCVLQAADKVRRSRVVEAVEELCENFLNMQGNSEHAA